MGSHVLSRQARQTLDPALDTRQIMPADSYRRGIITSNNGYFASKFQGLALFFIATRRPFLKGFKGFGVIKLQSLQPIFNADHLFGPFLTFTSAEI